LNVVASVGHALPDVELPATNGETINPRRLKGEILIFCYPWTGRPGLPDPPGWDHIPGAHGSTPQARAYGMLHSRFALHQVRIFGLSLQSTEYQQEFATRCALPFAFLSDARRRFSDELALPEFDTGSVSYLSRLTLFAGDGVIRHLRYPVPDPAGDAQAMLDWLASR